MAIIKKRAQLTLFFSALLLGACSAQLEQVSAPLQVSAGADGSYLLESSITLKASHAAPTELRAGTRWRRVGAIEQGNVFETKDQVVIVNSFDVHEASIVVSGRSVVGYYLKIGNAFVAVTPVPIVLTEEKK